MESNLARIACQLECRLHSLIGLQDLSRLQELCGCIIFSLYRSVVVAEPAMHVLVHQAISLRFIIGGSYGQKHFAFASHYYMMRMVQRVAYQSIILSQDCISAMQWLFFGRLLCFPFFLQV